MSHTDRIILGILFLLLTIGMAYATDGDITIGVFTIPVALMLIFMPNSLCEALDEDLYEDEDIPISKKEPQFFDLKNDIA